MSIKTIREFDARNDAERVSLFSSDERSIVVTVEPQAVELPPGATSAATLTATRRL